MPSLVQIMACRLLGTKPLLNNAVLSWIALLGKHNCEILIKIQWVFLFRIRCLEMSSANCRSFCMNFNVILLLFSPGMPLCPVGSSSFSIRLPLLGSFILCMDRSTLTSVDCRYQCQHVTSRHTNTFLIAGTLWGETTGCAWIPLTKSR